MGPPKFGAPGNCPICPPPPKAGPDYYMTKFIGETSWFSQECMICYKLNPINQ